MKCSKCGFENPNGFKFCCQCGTKLEVNNKCPKCGTTFPYEGIFCPECGTRVRVESIEKDRTSIMDMHPEELEFMVGSCSFKMIKVDGGTFTMGATVEQEDEAFDDERPAHKVTLSDYYIGQTEVTQALWTAVMGNNPSLFKGDNRPAEGVSWDDCQAFVEKLNRLLSSQLGGMRFVLPTEAQWEFAARGGNKSKGYKYAGSNNDDDVVWFCDNSYEQTHPVAQKKPNELGLYDMSGNVLEWCQDWYDDENYYRISPENNPQGPADGEERVTRGGSWGDSAYYYCRVSCRNKHTPDFRDDYLGFRLCLIP